MNELLVMQVALHSKLLKQQRIYRLVTSPLFEEAYGKASDLEKEIAEKIISDMDKDRLLKWIKLVLRESYETYNITELRDLGKRLGVKGYLYLGRDSLLSEIYKRKKDNERANYYDSSSNGKVNIGSRSA